VLEAQRDAGQPDDVRCRLPTAEFGVLQLLMAAKGGSVSRMDLSRHVFGRRPSAGNRAVGTVI
jgi:DNA-binding response OmpR family regulator